jgi:phage terminase large subunit GpA-like protein
LTAIPGAALPTGWIALPQVGEAVCKEICSEALVRRRVAGREVERWERLHRPNDALDGAIYARAAAQHAHWDMWTAADLVLHEAQLGTLAAPADAAAPPATAESSPPPEETPPPPRVLAPGEAPASGVTWRRSRYWDRRGPSNPWWPV